MADLQKALEWAKNNPGDERSIKLLDAVASGKITSDSVKAKTIQQEQDSVQKSLKDMSFMKKEFSSQGKGIGANLSLGATKGLLSTVQGLADIGEKTFGRIGGAIAEKITGKKAPAQTFEIPEYMRKAEGTAQSIGKGAEQIGEFYSIYL